MPCPGTELLAALDIPQPHRGILGGTCQVFTIRTEFNARDRFRMSTKKIHFLEVLPIPAVHLPRFLLTGCYLLPLPEDYFPEFVSLSPGTGNRFPIRAEADTCNPLSVPVKVTEPLATLHLLDL